MSVAQITNRRDVGTLASFQLQAREAVCLSDMFAILTASRRWHCAASKSGEPAWTWTLTKNRKGEPGRWLASWKRSDNQGGANEAGVIHLVAATAA